MTKKRRDRKTTSNKTDNGEPAPLWKVAGTGTTEDLRREERDQVTGDILWSYATDSGGNFFKGTITNESESGLCILTLTPIKAGSILRIYGEDRAALRDAAVIWCRKGSADIYKSGLSLANDGPLLARG
jgi:hypothetical protein